MSFGVLNAIMLAGLAAALLPIVVHLISKRKFDVVEWGAMQFLELGRRTRRRIRLEELLLLLLRMALLALVALALARPWAKGSLFTSLSQSSRRDVALVIDGSYSMGWEEKVRTPHAAAIQWAHTFLETLGGGDTVLLLDSRDRVRTVIDRPTGDLAYVREHLNELPAPSGTSHLVEAATKAAQLLAEGENLDREIVLIHDGQSLPWTPEDAIRWRQFDDFLSQATIRPDVWAINVQERRTVAPINFALDQLSLSRELTVPGFPMRFETTVRQFGGESTRREVHFAVNGQRLQDKTITVSLPANGEARVLFEHRFTEIGSYLVSISLDADHLPGDNQSDAAIVVSDGIPVLLVDGRPDRDRTKAATFFAHAALTPSRSISPWVRATVVGHHELSADALAGQRVAFLADVTRLNTSQVDALSLFVAEGGGLVVAPGNAIDEAFYNQLTGPPLALLPARSNGQQHESGNPLGDVNFSSDSLDVSWLARFRRENGVDLLDTRFAHWWLLEPLDPADAPAAAPGNVPAEDAAAAPPAGDDTAPDHDVGPPQVVARFDTNAPAIVAHTYGRGAVLQLAFPLDAEWTTLPARNDFVPLLHEMVFHLASRTSGRNVGPGMPLLADIPAEATADQYHFIDPDGGEHPAEPAGDATHPQVRLLNTDLPGTYRCVPKDAAGGKEDFFVVNFDRRESDLTPLPPPVQQQLAGDDRIRFIDSLEELQASRLAESAPSELWRWLLLLVLGILVGEVLLTRRLVQGGHEATGDDAVHHESERPPASTPAA